MKRVQLEIVLGTLLVLLSAAIMIILGFREDDHREIGKIGHRVSRDVNVGRSLP